MCYKQKNSWAPQNVFDLFNHWACKYVTLVRAGLRARPGSLSSAIANVVLLRGLSFRAAGSATAPLIGPVASDVPRSPHSTLPTFTLQTHDSRSFSLLTI
jgi:hypothetical protein